MKIHPPLVEALETSLIQIFLENRYSDKVLHSVFRGNKRFGSRDRRFIAQNCYDLVRHWRRASYAAGFSEAPPQNEEEVSRVVQQWLEFQEQEANPDWLKLWEECEQEFALKESLPTWLDQEGRRQLGDSNWEQQVSSMNYVAPVYLRTNTLKTDRESLVAALAEEKIECQKVEGSEVGLQVVGRPNVFATKAFKKGFFEVQDIGSQQIAPFLQPKAGEFIIDACAGAGGKSLHLAQLMGSKGRVLCLDIHDWKLTELKLRARRAGVSNIETRCIDSTKVIKRQKHKADAVLLDVPCTGLGVLRRNPDTKWKLSEERLSELLEIQFQILTDYSKMVKPGGRIVYATCSIFPSENQAQVEKFVSQNESVYQLEEQHSIAPTEEGSDGFYMARLRVLN